MEFYYFFGGFLAGLLHDREWVLTSLSGEILTQKKVKYQFSSFQPKKPI